MDAGTDAGEPTTSPNAAFEDEVLVHVNARRAAGALCGNQNFPPVPPLTMQPQLRLAAQLHSQDMAAQSYMDHVSKDGRTFDQRIRAAGYTGSSIAENVAAGYESPTGVVQGWMESPGHCVNIMGAAYRSIGVGYGFDADSKFGHYWTQTFGNR